MLFGVVWFCNILYIYLKLHNLLIYIMRIFIFFGKKYIFFTKKSFLLPKDNVPELQIGWSDILRYALDSDCFLIEYARHDGKKPRIVKIFTQFVRYFVWHFQFWYQFCTWCFRQRSCPTVLSVYNATLLCWHHRKRRLRIVVIHNKMGRYRNQSFVFVFFALQFLTPNFLFGRQEI